MAPHHTHGGRHDVEGPLSSAERYAHSALRYQMSLSLRANSRASKPVYLLKKLRHLHPYVLDMQGSARHIPVSSTHKNLDLNRVAFALSLKLITVYLSYSKIGPISHKCRGSVENKQ